MTGLEARLAGYHSPVLSIFRIIFGLLYTIHGSQKLFGWPIGVPGATVAVGDFPLWWAGLIEFVLGIMITLGFMTRIAAFIASGEMAFAYFYQHWPPLKGGGTASFWPIANRGELAIMVRSATSASGARDSDHSSSMCASVFQPSRSRSDGADGSTSPSRPTLGSFGRCVAGLAIRTTVSHFRRSNTVR